MKLDLIMVDECGDEVKVETFNVGDELDEDYMELWKDRKIEKARENYPEAQRFYFERPYSDMSYYNGALKALEFAGYEWKRDADGKHTLFKC